VSRGLIAVGLAALLGGCPAEDSGGDPDPDRPDPREPLAAVTIPLLPSGQPNLLVPIQVGLDATTRRAFVSSNGLPTLAEVDLDTGALVAVHALGDIPALHPLVAPGDDGGVWLGFDAAPALARFVPGDGEAVPVDTPLVLCHALVALPGGGVAAAGRDAAGADDRLVIVDASGDVREVAFSGSVMGMTLYDGGLAVLRRC
jgi:hypothetical protein